MLLVKWTKCILIAMNISIYIYIHIPIRLFCSTQAPIRKRRRRRRSRLNQDSACVCDVLDNVGAGVAAPATINCIHKFPAATAQFSTACKSMWCCFFSFLLQICIIRSCVQWRSLASADKCACGEWRADKLVPLLLLDSLAHWLSSEMAAVLDIVSYYCAG